MNLERFISQTTESLVRMSLPAPVNHLGGDGRVNQVLTKEAMQVVSKCQLSINCFMLYIF